MRNSISELIEKHEKYRREGINLMASENRLSEKALRALAGDLAGRYGNEWYGGSRYAIEICERVEELAKKLFKSRYAIITPVSGNICDLAVIFSFTKAGDKIAGIPKEKGGYPLGYKKFEREFYPLPVKDYVITVPHTMEDIPLILIAPSIVLFPHPVKELTKYNSVTVYDASHVLGLIAGEQFQIPLKEGADVMIASTHKSFPGPQGGIVLTNSSEMAEILGKYLLFDYEEGIGLIDNPHLNRIACLGIVMEEMLEIGREYARMVIKNARYLARCLHELGMHVKFEEKGFTNSHQILLDVSREFFERLEKNSIFIDRIGRIGTAEVTYIGMRENEMEEIAHFMVDVYKGKEVKEEVKKFLTLFISTEETSLSISPRFPE